MTRLSSIILIVITTLLTSSAQVLYKIGSENLTMTSILTNYHIILGLFLYGIGALLFIIALRSGELSVLYPIIATSYVWVSIMSVYILGENVSLVSWLGVAVIVSGITLIGLSSKKDSTIKYTEGI